MKQSALDHQTAIIKQSALDHQTAINVIVSFNFTKHGQLNLTYGTRIWKIKHFKNSLL
jgi:hypothetical protein